MAAGTVNALHRRGLRVPQDVSVMSIDGFNLAAIEDVPLTAVHVPRDELGNEAVQMLQQRLIRPDAPVGSLLLHGRLAVRESVRQVRQEKGTPPWNGKGCTTISCRFPALAYREC